MPRGFHKQNINEINNTLKTQNKRIQYLTKLKNKVEEKNGLPLTVEKLKYALPAKSNSIGSKLRFDIATI